MPAGHFAESFAESAFAESDTPCGTLSKTFSKWEAPLHPFFLLYYNANSTFSQEGDNDGYHWVFRCSGFDASIRGPA
jgi:hypothetical protein